jgi:glyoxylase-like metal-dependent hydrolase (beta-lactamase superfamily II)
MSAGRQFDAGAAARAASGASTELRIGRHRLIAISDGFFEVGPDFLGTPEHPTAGHDALRNDDGEVAVPLGCFVIPGASHTLIDLGLGAHAREGWDVAVSGGRLPSRLGELGIRREEVGTIALSHLHFDHVGWLCDVDAEPFFPAATVYVAAADWRYFIDGQPNLPLDPAVRTALLALAERGKVELLDDDREIVPGLTRLAAPGHTPGHSLYAITDGEERALVLGDAIACPAQLTGPDWSLASDVDPKLATATRERWFGEMETSGATAVGCHFPELRAGRILAGDWVAA